MKISTLNEAFQACGVYELVCVPTGDNYIGSASQSFAARWRFHRSCLVNGKSNKKLQALWNKYGEDAFEFNILLTCHRTEALIYEMLTINMLEPTLNTKKSCGVDEHPMGRKQTAQTIEKIRKARTGHETSAETRAKIGFASSLRTHSEKTRAQMSAKRKGVPKSEEFKRNLRKPKSLETRAKMRLAQQARFKNPISEETRQRIRIAQRARYDREAAMKRR